MYILSKLTRFSLISKLLKFFSDTLSRTGIICKNNPRLSDYSRGRRWEGPLEINKSTQGWCVAHTTKIFVKFSLLKYASLRNWCVFLVKKK